MPRMPEVLLDCAIYVYASIEDAQEGRHIGGSGFLVDVTTKHEDHAHNYIYAVTNWHVILKAGEHPVLRLNKKDGGTEILKTDRSSWNQHPDGDDVAIHPIVLSPELHRFSSVSDREFLGKERLSEVGPGTDTVMVGRFVTHDGRQKNLPSLRFGCIAMMPLEAIEHPHGYKQESFLVETRSIGGHSGSPVFAYTTPEMTQTRFRISPNAPLHPRYLKFIGIDCVHLDEFECVLDENRKPTTERMYVKSNTGMSAVIPAWRLRQLLYEDEIVTQRKEQDAKQHASACRLDTTKKMGLNK